MTSLVRVGVSGEVHAAARRVERPGEDVGLGEGVDAAADVGSLALGDAVDGLLTFEAHGLVCNGDMVVTLSNYVWHISGVT